MKKAAFLATTLLVLAITVSAQKAPPQPRLTLENVHGQEDKPFNGRIELTADGTYGYYNTGKPIKELECGFPPVLNALGKSQPGPTVDDKEYLKEVFYGPRNRTLPTTSIGFSGEIPIDKLKHFQIIVANFNLGRRSKMTCAAQVEPQNGVKLNESTSPSSGMAGFDYVSIAGSEFPEGNINATSVLVQLASECQGIPSTTTPAISVVSSSAASRLVSFLLPGGLSPGRYFVSISDSVEGDATFESSNCSEVTVSQ